MSTKFAKKEATNDKPKGLIVDLDKGKMANANRAPTTKTEREILEKAGVKPVKASKPNKAERQAALKKTAKGTKAKAERAPKDDNRTIKILAKENPYRDGTKAAVTFDLMVKGKTVSKFRELATKTPDNYDTSYLRYAERDGFIKLA